MNSGGDGGRERKWMTEKYPTCLLRADAHYFQDML